MQHTSCTEDRIQHALNMCLDGLRRRPASANSWNGTVSSAVAVFMRPGPTCGTNLLFPGIKATVAFSELTPPPTATEAEPKAPVSAAALTLAKDSKGSAAAWACEQLLDASFRSGWEGVSEGSLRKLCESRGQRKRWWVCVRYMGRIMPRDDWPASVRKAAQQQQQKKTKKRGHLQATVTSRSCIFCF